MVSRILEAAPACLSTFSLGLQSIRIGNGVSQRERGPVQRLPSTAVRATRAAPVAGARGSGTAVWLREQVLSVVLSQKGQLVRS
jgi:hypothetical protein